MVISSNAQRVQQALSALGINLQVVELPSSTRSAAEAAQAIGCQIAQIAKSLVFKGQVSGRPILIVASGVNRVNEARVAQAIGEPLGKADAEFVRQRTGYAIGGVPPIGHTEILFTLIDEDLFAFGEIWAAAGTPHAVFRLTPTDLVNMTGGRVLAIK